MTGATMKIHLQYVVEDVDPYMDARGGKAI